MDRDRAFKLNYETWLRYPVTILSPEEELCANIDTDSPGFVPRDYRYLPKLQLQKPHELATMPTELQMFFAWKLHNQTNAYYRTQKKWEQRWRRVFSLEQKMFNRRFSGKRTYPVTSAIVRRTFLELFETTLRRVISPHGTKEAIARLEKLVGSVDLNKNNYGDPTYQRYIEIITMVSQHVIGDQGLTAVDIDLLLSELKIIDTAISKRIKIVPERKDIHV